MSHNAVRVRIRNSCICLFFISAIFRISEEGKKTQHRSFKLEKVIVAHNYVWAFLHGGAEMNSTLMCKISPWSVVHLYIKRISHFGVALFSSFYDIDEKASYTSYHQSINKQLTKLQASQTVLGKPKLKHPGSTNGNHIRWASLHRSLTFRQVTHIMHYHFPQLKTK